ncbi:MULTISPECIES: hypothetical protein [Streptomyces]|uniref:Peptidase M10 metallopeptidase domain-containing protein n=2 Tax=Streptomyces TaxID=1883 RepID=A0A0B5F4X7_STRA4|nr:MULTISPECIES: hypothetical protein [Streptomyces]AJE85926.1 hypothetical protein SLNWT_5550 [Streptomyces albus]AOU80229.1 hypothetical protein SLNHY_5538 [Streptomyces albus]NKI43016.1 hypothetical protein [Streptomyces physcomitrii]
MRLPPRGRARRRASWIGFGWAAVALAVAGIVAPAAGASHHNTDPTQTHVRNMHYASPGADAPGSLDEQYCGEVTGSSYLTHAQATSFLRDTLVNQSDEKIWDGTGDYRIDLWLAPNSCSSYPQPERNSIEIEYHYAADWSSVCGGSYGYYNCAQSQNPLYNADYGHTDYQWKVIRLVDSSGGQLNEKGRAFINHETGHAWGLLDPRFEGDCHTPSIMHGVRTGYGCENWPNWWPSSYDFASVVESMNGG